MENILTLIVHDWNSGIYGRYFTIVFHRVNIKFPFVFFSGSESRWPFWEFLFISPETGSLWIIFFIFFGNYCGGGFPWLDDDERNEPNAALDSANVAAGAQQWVWWLYWKWLTETSIHTPRFELRTTPQIIEWIYIHTHTPLPQIPVIIQLNKHFTSINNTIDAAISSFSNPQCSQTFSLDSSAITIFLFYCY